MTVVSYRLKTKLNTNKQRNKTHQKRARNRLQIGTCCKTNSNDQENKSNKQINKRQKCPSLWHLYTCLQAIFGRRVCRTMDSSRPPPPLSPCVKRKPKWYGHTTRAADFSKIIPQRTVPGTRRERVEGGGGGVNGLVGYHRGMDWNDLCADWGTSTQPCKAQRRSAGQPTLSPPSSDQLHRLRVSWQRLFPGLLVVHLVSRSHFTILSVLWTLWTSYLIYRRLSKDERPLDVTNQQLRTWVLTTIMAHSPGTETKRHGWQLDTRERERVEKLYYG